MGVITIEVPQRVIKKYRIDSRESANEVIEKLDQITKKGKKVDLSGVLGIWSYRTESAEEIARELRKKSNSRVKNG